MVVQADGKIVIGGEFTSVSPSGLGPVQRNRIARFNVDGSLDFGFNPNANNTVFSIALQADGKILAGGTFTTIGGQARSRIARLDPGSGAADSFNPSASSDVYAIVVQADGKILAGGHYSVIGEQPRNHLARLDPASGAVDSFDPNVNGNVFALALQRDGKIVVGGNFTIGGGQTRNRLARLDAATGLADSFNPDANGFVEAVAVQADGKILAAGVFTTMGGQTRNRIARLNTNGTLDTSFDPNADAEVFCIAVQPDGNIVLGGAFTSLGGSGGPTRDRLARVDGHTGALDFTFDPHANNTVLCVALQADGKILAGGDFTILGGDFASPPITVTRNRIARLEHDGKPERTLSLNPVGVVYATALQPDGKLLIGGEFNNGGTIARLNSDGTLDTDFDASFDKAVLAIAVQSDGKILVGGEFSSVNGAPQPWLARLDPVFGNNVGPFNPDLDGAVFAIAVQTDGHILVGGDFTSAGGQPHGRLARLSATNGAADGMDPNANAGVYSIAQQADGKLLVGGFFTSIGGVGRNHFARLLLVGPTGTPDAFNPNAQGDVLAIALQADGKILAGGGFSAIGGQARNNIARVNPDGTLDTGFNPNASGPVYSLVVQGDGKVLAAGAFPSIGGVGTLNFLARLDPVTGAPDSFDPDPDNTVTSLALQPDGKILAGGFFSMIGGQSRNGFARLTNNTAASSTLTVTQSTITLTQGGSAPQFTLVSFGSDYEFDGIFGLVGIGTGQGSSYTVSGQNFPTGQNFLIRSRGYLRTGYANGSETTEEKLQNVFLPVPPTPTQVVSRKTHVGAGTFDIVLPLGVINGNPGIESRSGGASNDYQVVATFAGPVTLNSATVVAGTGSVANAAASGNAITVNLTGVVSGQRLTISLQGVSDGTAFGDIDVPFAVLIGDVNGDGAVNSADATVTRNRSGQDTDASNFRADYNLDGSINSADATIVRGRSGNSVP